MTLLHKKIIKIILLSSLTILILWFLFTLFLRLSYTPGIPIIVTPEMYNKYYIGIQNGTIIRGSTLIRIRKEQEEYKKKYGNKINTPSRSGPDIGPDKPMPEFNPNTTYHAPNPPSNEKDKK